MLYTGSLTKCIQQMAYTFRTYSNTHLAIIHNPHAKYYTLETMESLADYEFDARQDYLRIVFLGSLRELQIFSQSHLQLDLPLLDNNTNEGTPCHKPADSGDPVTQP